MEVSAEAKRIMVVALGKLYSSRTQRGGLRLHRSLLLSLVMKSARDIYHEAQATEQTVASGCEDHHQGTAEEPSGPPSALAAQEPQSPPLQQVLASPTELRRAENQQTLCVTHLAHYSRKRRGKAAAEPDFLPCKKAKLEQGISSHQLLVNSVLMDYVSCSSEVGAPPAPVPLQRAAAAC
ncbi:Immediate early response gene 2 protein [Channa argus]|uniref:Immediate early response gene 2 protein n=1 Tax=Channa argus TaxID=215402 RepID=A0A6G1QDV3_CHAAH|nr:Immediate early response gene 2 protein [Channa argus]KAK2893959.1 hypothetical protein Q8A73_016443 [Channa argus]